MNPWETLGIPEDAGLEAIKKAYRKLVRQCHPDLNPEDPSCLRRFLKLSDAYRELTRLLHVEVKEVGGSQDPETGMSGLFFNGQEGWDYSFFYLEVPMEAAYRGQRIKVRLQGKEVPCHGCAGMGYVWEGEKPVCDECQGKGYKEIRWGTEKIRIICKVCGATGYSNQARCPICRGKGRTHMQREVFISLPKGIRPGTILELAPPEPLGIGPTFLEIGIKFPEGWRLSGNDIVTRLKLDIWSALTGTTALIQTIDGKVPLEIPWGTPHGKEFILEGRGWTDKNGMRGAHRVVIELVMPQEDMTEEVRPLLERLKGLWPVDLRDRGCDVE